MLKIAVVEDDEITNQLLQDLINQYAEEKKLEIGIFTFRDGIEILEGYEAIYDIILMDIEMPKMNGMNAAEKIRQHDADVVLMFITNMKQYAIRGYSVRAFDYVLKPVNYYSFSLRLTRAISCVKTRKTEKTILLTLPSGVKALDAKEIYYLEIQDHTLYYYTKEGKYAVRSTMKSMEKELKDFQFVKCNCSYLVNLRYVTEINKDIVVVAGNKLQISRRNRTAFMAAMLKYVGGNT